MNTKGGVIIKPMPEKLLLSRAVRASGKLPQLFGILTLAFACK
jgi:hypothetical protein